jgi:hypothetical protein
VPIRTLPSRAIADASIQAVDIASNSISKAKIDADTRLGLQNDSIILDGTDGAGANKGDFLTLNGTDNSSTNADDRVLFNETFLDKVNLFNINTLGSAGQALKVNDAGNDFTFGSAGGLVKLASATASSSSTLVFNSTYFTSTYKDYKVTMRNVMFSSTSSQVKVRMSADNGSTFENDSYSYGIDYCAVNTSAGAKVGTSSTGYALIGLDPSTSANTHILFDLINFRLTSASNHYPMLLATGVQHNSNGNQYMYTWSARVNSPRAYNYIEFSLSTGNYASGEVTLYGILD